MKLVYLHQYFKFPYENGGTRSYDLAKRFVKKGIEVLVVTTTSDKKYKEKKWTVVKEGGLEVHYLYLPYDNSFSKLKRINVFIKFLVFSFLHIDKINCDIVLATSTPLTIGIPAILKKWKDKTPFIFEVRDVWPEAVIAIGALNNKLIKKLLYGLEKLIYKNAAAIVPLSTDMQQSIVSRFPELKRKADIVIENIAEIKRFQSNAQAINLAEVVGFKPRFSILYAGTFGKVNGIHKVIELAEKTLVLDKELVYFLVGSGAEKENIIHLAKDKDVFNKNVFILDPIAKSELPEWYNAVSMGSSFVIDIPELWRNSANKFFDTLAAAKPILINHEGWQAETIRDKNIGYVLPFEITESSVKKFIEYTNDESLIKTQSVSAIELAKKKFSLEVATANYLQIFEKI